MAEDSERRGAWRDAVAVSDLRRRLEPALGDRTDGSNTWGDAIGGLRELARKLDWASVPSGAYAPDLAFALALDKSDVEDRILAIVCRAYARAAEYAAVYHRLERDRAQSRKDVDRLRACIFAQRDEMDALLRRIAAHRSEEDDNDERRARQDRVDAAFFLTLELAGSAEACATATLEREQDPTLVYLLRLCHVFVLATKVKKETDIVFHDTDRKKNNWVSFLTRAIEVAGLRLNIDTSLRMVGFVGSYSTKYLALTEHVRYLMDLQEIATQNAPIADAQLPVSGIERRIGLPPAPQAWHSP